MAYCCRPLPRAPTTPRLPFPRHPSSLRNPSSFLPSRSSPPSNSGPPNLSLSPTTGPLRRRRRELRCCLSPCGATDGSSSPVDYKDSSGFKEWDSMTAKFVGAANVPFLLLQLPQIMLNSQNLLAGNKSALFAVPWMGTLTGLLGNLALLSYFVKKEEIEAILVQTIGVVSTYVVIVQLAMAESMPLPQFIATTVVVASGFFVNFLNYFNWLEEGIWRLWEDFITIGGLSVLPQVMWSTFVPFVPNSILPGLVSCTSAIVVVMMARTGKLSENGLKFVGSLSGWTATLLFMWMPIAQMWTNYLDPNNIRGLSALTMFLSMVGNGLLIPRALFIRDLMWFTGSTWASSLHGWGNLLCLYCLSSINKEFFLTATVSFYLWLGFILWRDTTVYGYGSPVKSLKELVSGWRT